jgi:SAM-dependent methyltransferase
MSGAGAPEQMREDWNRRAAEDANYYVAFGRRDQEDEEFFASAADVVRNLDLELKRAPSRDAALEIGCGPGRLMRPMSMRFREVHGVDVSDEMIRLAKQKLRGTPNAFAHHNSGSDLSQFPDGKFDFVYSYAVFQHIPSREVVFDYLRESRRVLKDDGILRCQINGLPPEARRYDTWSGVRITGSEVAEFARDNDLQLLALEQIWTQYMWITCRKRPAGWHKSLRDSERSIAPQLRSIGNAHTGEASSPAAGPFAALSLWISGLPDECDLIHLRVTADGQPCRTVYIGAPERDGVTQVNVALPEGVRTGLVPVQARWLDSMLCEGWTRIVPAPPSAPWVGSVTDGIDLLSGARIVTGTVKVAIYEVSEDAEFRAWVDGVAVGSWERFCTDPVARRYEFNFRLPEGTAPGVHQVRVRLGRREFPPVPIETV